MKKTLEQSVILVGTFLIAFMGSGLNPAIPSIAEEFHLEVAQSGWIVTAYMITCTALPIPFSRWGQVKNPKGILAGGLGLFTAASLAGLGAGSMSMLTFVRGIQGVGTAMIYSTGTWILISGQDGGSRSRLLGLSSATMYLGLASGPAAGGILNQYLGWRYIFAAAAVISAAAFWGSLILLWRSLSEPPSFPPPGKISPSGVSCLLYVMAAGTFTAGLQLISAGWWGWLITAAGLLLMVLYAVRERNMQEPLLPLKFFRKRPVLWMCCLSSMISCGVNFVMNYLLSLYFQIGLGFTAQKAGLLLILSPAVQALTSAAVGRISVHRVVKARTLAAAGILGSGAAAAYFAGINEGWTSWMICGGLGAAGFFSGLFTAPNTGEVMEAAGKEYAAMASALISTVRSLGNSMGVASAAFEASVILGQTKLSEASPQDLGETVKLVFYFWAVLCILGFFMEFRKKV